MNLRIQNQDPSNIHSSADLKSGSAQSGTSSDLMQSTNSTLKALDAAQDTASISPVTSQLSGDVPIRQDRVDALRTHIESGTYTVNSHAVATAMFQNLFRS